MKPRQLQRMANLTTKQNDAAFLWDGKQAEKHSSNYTDSNIRPDLYRWRQNIAV